MTSRCSRRPVGLAVRAVRAVRAALPVGALATLVALPLWLGGPVVTGVAAVRRAPAVRASSITATASDTSASQASSSASASANFEKVMLLPWERRLVASLPARVRVRAARILADPSGASSCITEPGEAEHGQAWLTGLADVAKLHGAALVGPALAEVVALTEVKICPGQTIELSTEVPDFHGKPEFPPMTATFLAFGFVPVTATIQLSQLGIGILKVSIAGSLSGAGPYVASTRVQLNVKVLKVKVNGVPLSVGGDCGTAGPGIASLSSINPSGLPGRNFWSVFTGGPLSGTVDLPHFAHCGVNGDNLDPILDASISGPQNFTKLIQGAPCIIQSPLTTTCPPAIPKPRR